MKRKYLFFVIFLSLFSIAFAKINGKRSRFYGKGHSNPVYSVAFNSNGKTIISGSGDMTLKLWDCSWTFIKEFNGKGHTGSVYSVDFSPDGQTIVSGSADGTLKLWDSKTGQEISGFYGKSHAGPVYSVDFSPDGKMIIIGCIGGGILKLLDASTGKEISGFYGKGHNGPVCSVDFSPDGQTIVSGSADGTLKLWDTKTGQEISGFYGKGHESTVFNVSFGPDGQTIVSGSGDGTLKLWDSKTGQEISGFYGIGHNGTVLSVDFSPDGQTIVSGSADGTLKLWDAKTGQEISGFYGIGHNGAVLSVDFSPDGETIVSGSGDRTLKLWDAGTGKEVGKFYLEDIIESIKMAFKPVPISKPVADRKNLTPTSKSIADDKNIDIMLNKFRNDINQQLTILEKEHKVKVLALQKEKDAILFEYFKPKDQFEKTIYYKKRLEEGKAKEPQIEEEFKAKLKDLVQKYRYETMKINQSKLHMDNISISVGKYNADEETFNITLIKTGETKKVNVPILTAKNFKKIKSSLKTSGDWYLKNDDSFGLSNVIIKDPYSGKEYPVIDEIRKIQKVEITANAANIRSGSNKDKNVIQVAHIGEKFILTNKVENWYQIKIGDKEGWIHESTASLLSSMPDIIQTKIPLFPAEIELSSQEWREPSGNRALDAGEKGYICLEISNTANYGGNVEIMLTPLTIMEGIKYEKKRVIGILKGNEKKEVLIPFEASMDVETFRCKIRCEIIETFYKDIIPFIIEFDTRAFQPPEFSLILRDYDDSKKYYPSNRPNGKLEAGEIIHVILNVQNVGAGKADNVSSEIKIGNEGDVVHYRRYLQDVPGVKNTRFNLNSIDRGKDKDIDFYFFTNPDFKDEKVEITLAVNESWGKYGKEKLFQLSMGQNIQKEKIITAKTIENDYKEIELIASELVPVENVPTCPLSVYNDAVAVVIGIEDYKHVTKAEYKLRDAQYFYEYCKKVFQIPEENIYFKTNENATKAELDYIFSKKQGWLKKRINKGKTDVILYFGGHGFHGEDGKPHLVPYNVRPEQTMNTISIEDVSKKIIDMEPNRVFFYVESCFSGVSGYQEEDPEGISLVESINMPTVPLKHPALQSDKIIIISATSSQNYSSNASNLKHGIFTYYLLEAFQGKADMNNDGKTTVSELFEHVSKNTESKALLLFDREQTPEIMPRIQNLGARKDWVIVSY